MYNKWIQILFGLLLVGILRSIYSCSALWLFSSRQVVYKSLCGENLLFVISCFSFRFLIKNFSFVLKLLCVNRNSCLFCDFCSNFLFYLSDLKSFKVLSWLNFIERCSHFYIRSMAFASIVWLNSWRTVKTFIF